MELFETFDDDGNFVALVPRAEVHRRGLWHKSAQIFIFNPNGQLLIQQRSDAKDLYPGLWDYSVGEHLVPGEKHDDGALRGLREELGIDSIKLVALGERRLARFVTPLGVDCEIQQAFAGLWAGAVHMDAVEVQKIEWIGRDALLASLAARARSFTPSFHNDFIELDIAANWNGILDRLDREVD